MGGLKSAFKSIKRFVKKNTRDIATVIGFAIGGPAGAAIGQGIGSLGEGRDFKDSVMSAGKVYAGASMAQGAGLQGGQGFGQGTAGTGISFGDPITGSGGIGGFFEDVGATGRDMFGGGDASLGPQQKFGSGDLMGGFEDLNMLQKAGVLGIGASALSGGDDAPAEMPGPIDQSGYLQQGLTPAVLSDVYGPSGGSSGIAGSMPSLANSYDYDPVNSSLEEFLRKQQEYELDFPEFDRIQVRGGGEIGNMMQPINLMQDFKGGVLQGDTNGRYGLGGGPKRGGGVMELLQPVGDFIENRIGSNEIQPTLQQFATTIDKKFPANNQGGGQGEIAGDLSGISNGDINYGGQGEIAGLIDAQPMPMPMPVNRPPPMSQPLPVTPTPGMLQPVSPSLDQQPTNAELPEAGNFVARLADGGQIPQGDLDLREDGGDINDPEGSGDEDTVPALLADGEFVMTKQAVAGIGDGDHEFGIAQLYDMMNMNEDKAQGMGIGRA